MEYHISSKIRKERHKIKMKNFFYIRYRLMHMQYIRVIEKYDRTAKSYFFKNIRFLMTFFYYNETKQKYRK